MLIVLTIGAFIAGCAILAAAFLNPSLDPTGIAYGLIIDFIVLIIAGVIAKGKLRNLAFAMLGALLIPFSILGIASWGLVTLLYGIGILGVNTIKLLSKAKPPVSERM